MSKNIKQLVRIRSHYPHHESLRDQVGILKQQFSDGTVLVHFEDGPHKGDRVCLDQRYIELLQ